VSRRIVKDHGGHLVNQPRLSLFAYCEKATVGNQLHSVRKTNKHRTWWSKFTDEESMRMYTKDWVKFNWGKLVWLKKCLNKV